MEHNRASGPLPGRRIPVIFTIFLPFSSALVKFILDTELVKRQMSALPKSKLHVCFGGLVICPPYHESKEVSIFSRWVSPSPYRIPLRKQVNQLLLHSEPLICCTIYSVNFIAVAYTTNLW